MPFPRNPTEDRSELHDLDYGWGRMVTRSGLTVKEKSAVVFQRRHLIVRSVRIRSS
jgi:hypothetical protein